MLFKSLSVQKYIGLIYQLYAHSKLHGGFSIWKCCLQNLDACQLLFLWLEFSDINRDRFIH